MTGDRQFEELYVGTMDKVFRFLYWQTGDRQLAEDLTSETFSRAWRSRSSFHGGSWQAWVFRIARNLLIDHWRRQKELSLDENTVIQSEDQAAITQWELAKALDQLPARMNAVVVLRFIDGLSVREVAQALDLSEANVRIVQFRALQKLRGILDV